MEALARILVRIPNWLGDALLARPLLHSLKHGFPQAELLGVGPRPLIDLLLADRALARGDSWPADRAGRAAVSARISAWAPDAAVVLPQSFSSALLAWRSRAPIRVGYAAEARGFLLTRALPRLARGELHLSREFLRLGALLGVEPAPLPLLSIPDSAMVRARALLDSPGGSPLEPHVVIAPRSAWGPAREWSEARWIELGRRLASRGLRVLVCGTASEGGTCERIAAEIGDRGRSIAGKTDLETLAALAREAALAVGNDSGFGHVAAGVGAPTVVIYSSASSAWTAPLGPRVRIVQRAPVCSPCYQRTCSIGYRCLTAVVVQDVLAACDEVMSRPSVTNEMR